MTEIVPSWELGLVNLIRKAYNENKLLRSHYQGLVFTPKALVEMILKGRFRWGVVNWELVERDGRTIDFNDPIVCSVSFLKELE